MVQADTDDPPYPDEAPKLWSEPPKEELPKLEELPPKLEEPPPKLDPPKPPEVNPPLWSAFLLPIFLASLRMKAPHWLGGRRGEAEVREARRGDVQTTTCRWGGANCHTF